MLKEKLFGLVKDESGAAAVEYGLIIGLVSLALVVAATVLSGSMSTFYSSLSSELGSAKLGGNLS